MAAKKAALIVHFDEDGEVIKVTNGKGKALKKKRTEKQKMDAIHKVVPYQVMKVQPKGSKTTVTCFHLPSCRWIC